MITDKVVSTGWSGVEPGSWCDKCHNRQGRNGGQVAAGYRWLGVNAQKVKEQGSHLFLDWKHPEAAMCRAPLKPRSFCGSVVHQPEPALSEATAALTSTWWLPGRPWSRPAVCDSALHSGAVSSREGELWWGHAICSKPVVWPRNRDSF